jgi:hypoxanthine phosphoribosyltransferase
MAETPYDYARRDGVLPISWQDMHGLCRALAVAVADFAPEIVLAVGRGGNYAGTLISHMLRVEVYPIRLTRRVNDVVMYPTPRWVVEPPAAVTGQRVLIVDEISSSGETLALARERVDALGAAAVRTAVLYAHTWGTDTPDYIGLVSDALILNPWDREVVQDGRLVFHPEYAAALAQQGLAADPALLIDAPAFTLAKAP